MLYSVYKRGKFCLGFLYLGEVRIICLLAVWIGWQLVDIALCRHLCWCFLLSYLPLFIHLTQYTILLTSVVCFCHLSFGLWMFILELFMFLNSLLEEAQWVYSIHYFLTGNICHDLALDFELYLRCQLFLQFLKLIPDYIRKHWFMILFSLPNL